jgi:hypothetical protein
MTGQAFHPSEGLIIGKLDSAGKLVLAVDLATLTPDLADKLRQYHKSGSELQMSPALSR